MATTLAKGTVITVETAPGSGVYVKIPKQSNLTGPNLTSTSHNVSSHDTEGLGVEKILGMVDPGQAQFQIWEDIANQALHRQLMSDKKTLQIRNYRKVWPTGHYIGFQASVQSYGPQHGVDAPHQASVTLELLSLHTDVVNP